MEKIIITKTPAQTREVGESVARSLTDGAILCLHGELGSGKTTFVQGLAKGLGITQRIISPTFVIIRSYPPSPMNHEPITHNFYHVDLYRVETQEDLKGLGIEEVLNDPQNIVAIEWAEKLGDLMPEKRIDIEFEHVNRKERKITVKTKGILESLRSPE